MPTIKTRPRAKKPINPSRYDPSSTTQIQLRFMRSIDARFTALHNDIIRLIVIEDALSLKKVNNNRATQLPLLVNVFCPTGKGGGSDPTCRKHSSRILIQIKAITAGTRGMPRRLLTKVRLRAVEKYKQLESRYGPIHAKIIIGSAILGIPLPVPGASFITAAPALAIAEMHKRYVGMGRRKSTSMLGDRDHAGNRLVTNIEQRSTNLSQKAIRAAALELIRDMYHAFGMEAPEGLEIPDNPLVVNVELPRQTFVPATDPNRLELFNEWLRTKIKTHLTNPTDQRLYSTYIAEGYQRGYRRGTVQAKGKQESRMAVRALSQRTKLFSIGLGSNLDDPIAGNKELAHKIKQLVSRTYTEVEGITSDMATKINRIMADGLVQNKTPVQVASELSKQVKLSKQRALAMARTEIVRAQAEGQLDAYEMTVGKESRVTFLVEWQVSAMACPLCAPLKGLILTLQEARGRIPQHVNCRCAFDIVKI